MAKCTWVDCTEDKTTDLKSLDGMLWASLCKQHDNMIDDAIRIGDPKIICSRWVKAQGGAKIAAERTAKEMIDGFNKEK